MSASLKPWLTLSAGLHLALALGVLLWLRRASQDAGETVEHIRQSAVDQELAAARVAESALRHSMLEHARAQLEGTLDQVLDPNEKSPAPELLREQFEARLAKFWSQADTNRLMGTEAADALRETRAGWLEEMQQLSEDLREQAMERLLADLLRQQVLPRVEEALENALRHQVAGELDNRVMQSVREDARGTAEERRPHDQQKALQREIVERALGGIHESAQVALDAAMQQQLAPAVARLSESARHELNRSGQQAQLQTYLDQHLGDALKQMLGEFRPDATLATARLRSANNISDAAAAESPSNASGSSADAVTRAQSAAEQALQSQMGQAVQRGLEAARFNGMLNSASRAGELQGFLSLSERIAQARGDLARHGDESGDALDLGLALTGGPPVEAGTAGFEPDSASRLMLAGQEARVQFNREVYEAYLHRMQARGSGLDDSSTNTPMLAVSAAVNVSPSVVATIYVPAAPTRAAAPEPSGPRTIPEPEFEHVAFGTAPRLTNRLTIDGDLSDWGELTRPMTMRYAASSASPMGGGPVVFMRWAAEGLYFAARVQDGGGIQPCPQQVYQGDGLEVWLDTLNSRRKLMSDAPSSHQLFFTPFGYRGNANSTFAEWGRGARGLRMDTTYPDDQRARGWSAAKLTGDGYTVEGFLKRNALAFPRLEPGRYLAVNFSVNLDGARQFQWSASKAIGTWDKPFTWGDVLLLGTDASLTAAPLNDLEGSTRNAAAHAEVPAAGSRRQEAPPESGDKLSRPTSAVTIANHPRKAIAPGEAVRVTVTDGDMNFDGTQLDQVVVRAAVRGSLEWVLLVLGETGPDSGEFSGSFDTQPLYQPAQRNSVRVRGGDVIELTYQDAHQSHGERNQRVTTAVTVGWPVMQLARE